jgi:hypothetical protein
MAAVNVTIRNKTGGDKQAPGASTPLAGGASRPYAVAKLLADPDAQEYLKDEIADLETTYNGIALDAGQIENLAVTLAQLSRASDHPELTRLDVVTGAALLAAGSDLKLVGTDLLQGQTFDGLTIGAGIDQLDFELMKPGESGHSLELLNTGSLSVAFAAGKWSIGYNFGTDTADQIANFVNAHATSKGVLRCVSGGVGTATPATPETPLAGGDGNYAANKVFVAGTEVLPLHAASATPAATWGDTLIEVTVPAAVGGAGATDVCPIKILSNGKETGAISPTMA